MTTIVTRAGKGSALTHNEVDANFTNLNNAKYESGNNVTLGTISGTTITASTAFSGALNGTVGATTPAAGTFTSLTDSGNLTFTGTGNRITGDFSNGTLANRVAFQTSTTNSVTVVSLLPNGTGLATTLLTFANSDPTNTSFGGFSTNGSTADVRLISGITGTGTYLPMTFYTGGSERMRIDTSGNVGIGTSSTAYKLSVNGIGNFYSGVAGLGRVFFGDPADPSGYIGIYRSGFGAPNAFTAGNALNFASFDGYTFNTGIATFGSQTERMRIDSSGNLLVGTTDSTLGASNTGFAVLGTASFAQSAPSANANCVLYKPASAAQTAFMFFNTNNSFIASITQNGNSAVSYNTTSDYRLKNDVTPMENALEKVALLKPVNWKWKVDGSHGEGFIAHELAEVIPYAVSGEKDAVDKEGKPVHQGVDTSFLVATLTAAIQELNAKVTALEAQLQGN